MFARLMTLWRPDVVAFSTPGIGKIFLGCRLCRRVVPQYRCYGNLHEPGIGLCRCGSNEFSPMPIAEWYAAWLVLSRLVWRKWILKRAMWDPRISQRIIPNAEWDDAKRKAGIA